MARKPTRGGQRGARRGAARKAAPANPRDRVIDALMMLAAGRSFASIGLADVAAEAGVSLADLRELYDGKLSILADFSKRVDKAVLSAGPPEGEGARDRLFDVLMRRLDMLARHKPALRRLARSARCDPGLACGLYRISEKSMMWMLVGAGIHHGGFLGKVAVRGTVLVFAEAMSAWLDDDDAGLAKTMATLDKALRRGERAMGFIGEVCDLARSFTRRDGRRRGSQGAKAAG